MSISELLLTAFVALIVLGPGKIPTVARTISVYIKKIRKIGDDLKQEFETHFKEEQLRNNELRAKEAEKNLGGRVD